MSPTGILVVLLVIMTTASVILFQSYNYYRSLVKQRGSFRRWPIPSITLDQLDPIFHTNELGPTLETSVQFIGRGHLIVPGGTSDTEAWVLSVLSKKAKTIFEFGTCTGKTTYLMALNSSPEARISSLTLPPEKVNEYVMDAADSKRASERAISESGFTRFLYTGTPEEKKINQLFGDSKHFEEQPFEKKMDLIFIDGSHAYSYVISDSEKAFKMVADGGLILWHDYRGPSLNKDVYKALNRLAADRPLRHIEGTSFIVYRQPARTAG